MLTKAPPKGETMPGSVVMAATIAATAASTALPPARAAATPASAEAGPVAATATRLSMRRFCTEGGARAPRLESDGARGPAAGRRGAAHRLREDLDRRAGEHLHRHLRQCHAGSGVDRRHPPPA